MLYLGTQVTPLVYVEVTPVLEYNASPHISIPFIKHYLINQGILIVRRWIKNGESMSLYHGGILSVHNKREDYILMNVPTINVASLETCPCRVLGYGRPAVAECTNVLVTQNTLIRILPNNKNNIMYSLLWNENSYIKNAGELPTPPPPQTLRHIHECTTVETLRIRMSMLLDNEVLIGSTDAAILNYKRRKWRIVTMHKTLESYLGRKKIAKDPLSQASQPKSDGSIIVHSPNHGDGKTLLVRKLAQSLDCYVHIIEVSSLLAIYGIHADAALETLLHSIVFSAAVRQKRICIILDHLPAFGATASAKISSAPDATSPILMSMVSYLKTLTKMIEKKEFPFPTKNPLYNPGSGCGSTFPVRVCFVGIATCSDESLTDQSGRSCDIVSMLHGGSYRFPEFTTQGRIQTMLNILEGVQLTEAARLLLPSLVASRIDLRGNNFTRVKLYLQQMSPKVPATVEDLKKALASIKPLKKAQYEVVVHSSSAGQDTHDDLFSSVGGNDQAKAALQNAMAIDPRNRDLLRKYDMSPPSGVLLYGPPGTGKTMLARAVAKLVNVQSGFHVGAFFSIQASEIVRSEVGNSEKELVSVFNTAAANAPAVIFIDEFQALFTDRGGGGSRLTSTLLHCMDDLNRWADFDREAEIEETPRRVIVIGATNTPWSIDKAFLRAGRFDKVIHVGLPTKQERRSIINVHIQRMRMKEKTSILGKLCEQLAVKTEGFSGADIAALCKAAAVRCLLEQSDDGMVGETHFLQALAFDIQASSSKELVAKLLCWKP